MKESPTTQVWEDTICGEAHQGLKLDKQRFGELVVVRAVDRHESCGSIIWLCRCDCGRVALRTSGNLMRARREGSVPMCSVCLVELRGGQTVEARAQWAQRFIQMFAEYGTLYNPDRDVLFEEEIKEELELRGFSRPFEEVPASLEISALSATAQAYKQQRAAYLAPMSGRTWQCECKAFFDTGFACLACLDPACRDCVMKEDHRCPESNFVFWPLALTAENFEIVFKKGLVRVEGRTLPLRERKSQLQV